MADFGWRPPALRREGQQQRFVARDMVEDRREEGGVLRGRTSRVGGKAGQRQKTVEPFGFRGNEAKRFNRKQFRAFPLPGNRLSAHAFAFL